DDLADERTAESIHRKGALVLALLDHAEPERLQHPGRLAAAERHRLGFGASAAARTPVSVAALGTQSSGGALLHLLVAHRYAPVLGDPVARVRLRRRVRVAVRPLPGVLAGPHRGEYVELLLGRHHDV